MVQIEENVTRWLCDLFDYPEGSQGLLLSGGSMANLSAMVTARHAKLGEDFTDGTYYVSEQAHASVPKAATIAGFSKRNVRIVPTDDELRMDPEALRDADRARTARTGCGRSWWRRASGTTNTGAIDPIDAIADIADAEGLWLHVDGAYGGFFQLTDRGRERFRGDRAEPTRSRSIRTRGCSCRTGPAAWSCGTAAAMRDAHYEGAAYLQDLPPTGELPNYSEHSAELSRDWRGLRVWMPLKLHGVSAFREALDEKLDLAAYLADAFRDDPTASSCCWEPQLTVIPFRLAGADDDTQQRVPRADQRVEAGVPVEHDDRRALRAAGVHREPSHAQGPDRRVHRDRRSRPPTSCGPEERTVPEMPEIRALAERLDQVMAGATLAEARPAAVLVAEDVRAAARRGARSHDRAGRSRGKYVVIELDGGMRAARASVAGRARRRRGAAEADEAARRRAADPRRPTGPACW